MQYNGNSHLNGVRLTRRKTSDFNNKNPNLNSGINGRVSPQKGNEIHYPLHEDDYSAFNFNH